nr:hypothetical protein GCM10020093_116780 [Planobispora longispora]
MRYVEHLKNRGRVTFGEVAEADVTAFLAALREGDETHRALVASSAARAVSAVRGLHRFALREGVSGHDPALRIRPPRQLRRAPRAIGVAEVERLIAAAGPAGAPLTLRNRALLELLYGTGARISEAVGLAVDDVDLDPPARQVRLRGKGGQARAVPLGRPAGEALDAYLARARPDIAAHGRGATPGCSSTPAAAGSPARARGRSSRPRPSAPGWPVCHRICCGIRSQRTSWTAARTLGWCRNCSATLR